MPDLDRHLEFAVRQFSDPRVADWHWPGHLGGSRTRDQVVEELAKAASECSSEGFGYWWWRERDSGQLVGMAGLHRSEVEREPVVEAAWSLSPAHWGRGYALEAARASIAWGFEVVRLQEIVAFTMPENERSWRVMERLGMEYVRNFDRKGYPQVLYRARPPSAAGAA